MKYGRQVERTKKLLGEFVMHRLIPVMALCVFADSVRLFVDIRPVVLPDQAAVDQKLTVPISTVTQPMCFAVAGEFWKLKQKVKILNIDPITVRIYISCLSILPCWDSFLSADSTLSKVTPASFTALLYCSKAANSADVLREL